jgi:hypothetical protein
MDKRLNKKIETYIVQFKDDIRDKIKEQCIKDSDAHEIMQFIYDYERLTLLKDDLTKRKRVKNSIPGTNRCNAKRANGEQCTRRRKTDCEFCGTHSKGAPHGLMGTEDEQPSLITKHNLEIRAEDIDGIIYHIDKFNNVYSTEDILKGGENPTIIATYKNGMISLLNTS